MFNILNSGGEQPNSGEKQSADAYRRLGEGASGAATRRTVLKAAAASGVAVGLGSTVQAQDGGTTFELDGVTSGWVGQSPDEIADEENPTLQLEVGETYTVEWTNADGVSHDFTILDADGNELEGTETMDEQGETRTLEFEATEEMAQYYCSVHPATMRGDIELAGQEGDGETAEDLLIEKGPTVGLETVAEGFNAPLGFVTAEEEADRRYILDQTGQVYVHEEDGLREEPFLDIEDRLPELGLPGGGFDERGLLGMAFHPDYEENCRVFVRYSAERGSVTSASYDHTFVLAEFEADEDRESIDPDSERRLLEIPEPQFNHNAGPIAFGPDGYLYVTIGDGGGADDTGLGHVQDWYDENEGGNAQNTRDELLGGILRIDVDDEEGGKPYAIPDNNPFAQEEEEAEEESEDGESEGGEEDSDDAATDEEGGGESEEEAAEDKTDDEDATADDGGSDDNATESIAVAAAGAAIQDNATNESDDETGLGNESDDTTGVGDNESDDTTGVADNESDGETEPVEEDDGEADDETSADEDESETEDAEEEDTEDAEEEDEEEDDEEEEEEVQGLAEYYAWGMRNPWGMSFTEDDELLAADVGQNLFEEINHVAEPGNYGWNVKEGTHCFNTDNPGDPLEDCPDETPSDVRGGEELHDPVIEYPQQYGSQNIGSSVTGGRMYEGDGIEELQDAYVFGDWSATFEEARGKLFVAYPPEDWPDNEELEESLADQVDDEDHPTYDIENWEDVWPIDQLRVAADDDELIRNEDELDRYVLAFGDDGEDLYVLTSDSFAPQGETGAVHRIVHPDEVGDGEDAADDEDDQEMDGDEEATADDGENGSDNESTVDADDESGDNESAGE